jgi:hypothetical protein
MTADPLRNYRTNNNKKGPTVSYLRTTAPNLAISLLHIPHYYRPRAEHVSTVFDLGISSTSRLQQHA